MAQTRVDQCDLAIVGAGIAGLNALFVATEYLPRDAKIVLIDRKPRAGGMWNDAYGYVRLHQPHRMFTVGDLPWGWDMPANYLATGQEVRDHLQNCLDRIRDRVDLVERFGFELEHIAETFGTDGPGARLVCRDVTDGTELVVEANRVVNAPGFDVTGKEPLTLSSGAVTSTTPEALNDVLTDGDAPVYVVGGGKTGMDTVQMLMRQATTRPIRLINGRGTVFINRTKMFPDGAGGRWWGSPLQLTAITDVVMHFDGANTEDAFDYFRQTYTVCPTGKGAQFMLGILSESESTEIAGGLDAVIPGYLEDVVDGADGTELVMRDGGRMAVPEGSIFVNCTGHLFRKQMPYTPYLSPNGAILTISQRSAVHFLPSASGYFCAHLFYLGKLPEVPIYEIDLVELLKEGRQLWYLTVLTHAVYNMIQLMDALPFDVLNRCGLDPDRWFPLPRRAASVMKVKMNRKRYLDHCETVLARVHAEHGTRVGPLARRIAAE
ncbi:FAD-dependent oxidoreductase [Pseudoruegeria sp. HB172150]|uniref:FAD-dependent oxidoreductase n=1 Tax=Pseudoruegeria sp. HB172150 TaxID=2721164 RepID=UPI001556DE41|nr:FAD-dependent oxidoreductase [Pseudoruegeria sp. HB172150]